MSRVVVSEISTQLYEVKWRSLPVGHVARGQLIEQHEGHLTVRGKAWHIIGWEYQEFQSLNDAVEALSTRYRNLCDAHEEVNEIKRLESFIPYAKRVARRSKKRSMDKKISRDMKRNLCQLRVDYRESIRRASLGTGNFNTLEVGGG